MMAISLQCIACHLPHYGINEGPGIREAMIRNCCCMVSHMLPIPFSYVGTVIYRSSNITIYVYRAKLSGANF